MTRALLVALAGGGGAVLRYWADQLLTRLTARRLPGSVAAGLPWPVVAVNVVGSLVLGLVTAAATAGTVSTDTRVVLGVGLCGGFTTFSTSVVDTVRLADDHRWAWAATHAVATAVLCTTAAGLGWWLAS